MILIAFHHIFIKTAYESIKKKLEAMYPLMNLCILSLPITISLLTILVIHGNKVDYDRLDEFITLSNGRPTVAVCDPSLM